MKDNISIIFAAIIGTFLIVLLPLYSILDRQDSMSYNVVLTSTTNFVDSIRNNGFIDKESYYNYISALASTSNTYKVTLEAYRKILISETDEFGNIIQDSYVEEIELYNTKDILEVLEGNTEVDVTNSNEKNNVFLFNPNDEIYVKVHNTNMTAGSVIYNVIAGASNSKVINVSYGGVVNKINWDLYDKIQAETTLVPEVVMSVPVNGANSTNIKRVNADASLDNIDCSLENLEDYTGETSLEDLCGDVIGSTSGENYTYLYDLAEEVNKTIRVAVELKRFDSINGPNGLVKLSELKAEDFEDENGVKSSIESHIIKDYIRLNGMYASVDLSLREDTPYYVFEIKLTNVRMSELDYISSLASITILPGLGQDQNGTLSIGAETVQIELTDETAVNTVMISNPYIWNKLIKTKNLTDSRILDDVIYSNMDIAFVISYTGINDQSDESILAAIEENLKVYINEAKYSNLEIFTAKTLNDNYGINIQTDTAGHVIVKFRYTEPNTSKNNYIELLDGWIATNIEEVIDAEEDEELVLYASGAKSTEYAVILDDSAPLEPSIALDGIRANDDSGWYISDVTLNLVGSTSDTIRRIIEVETSEGSVTGEEISELGGSGVYKNTLILEGAMTLAEQEITQTTISTEGISYAIAKAYDYVGNVVETKRQEIKIDKTAPTAPKINLIGDKGANGWYTSNVRVEIIPGTDITSGVEKTTFKVEGANEFAEIPGTSYRLETEGKSTVIATTYDKAGNKTETAIDVYIDKSEPSDATISVIQGEKNSPNNDWYYTDVTLKVTVDAKDSISGLGTSSYRITGNSEVPTTEFEGTTKEITITTNGTHNVTVYTCTVAGNCKDTKYTVKIDKDAPNAPTIKVNSGAEGENGWFTSNVELEIVSNGDVGPSFESDITYTITNQGTTTIEKEIKNNGKIFFNKEGEYILKVYSRDIALNKVVVEKIVKIDKTKPTAADFVITGTKGVDDWYISDVTISHQGSQDAVSGIQSVTLSSESITENTTGKVVTLVTKDNAGHTVTKDITIKLDKSVPTDPIINLDSAPTGTGPFGMNLYNKDIQVTITPGVDYFMPGVDNLDKTTYEVTSGSGSNVIIPETEGTSFKITEEGIITIIARTYDKAGNVALATKVLWISKTKPATPVITSINETNVENSYSQTITSTSNIISLGISKVTEGNDINITLINQSTYERIVITKKADLKNIQIQLSQKGTYSIKVTQTNMFGTLSDESTGLYLYKYE